MGSLQALPTDILDKILWFLPQELILNLSLTNYHFYEPCSKKLYKNIVIQKDPMLRPLKKHATSKGLDFLNLSKTVINGFSLVSTSPSAHMRMICAKLQTLINSIQINGKLATFIWKIQTKDTFDKEVTVLLYRMFELLARTPNSLHKVYIADAGLRSQLKYHTWRTSFTLKSVTIDDLAQLNDLGSSYPNLNELIVAGTGETNCIQGKVISTLKKLTRISIRDDLEIFRVFSGALWDLYKETPFMLENLRTINLVHDHSNWTHGFPYINFTKLENFQISLGCNNLTSCNQECLEMGLLRFEFGALKRLSIIQSTESQLNNHINTEKWDLVVFSFIETVLETSKTLMYLSIRHNVPQDGIINDGIDGLYLRKVKLYTEILPKMLAKIESHVVNLVLPNLMASLSCYEQAMNTLLWIGCKCPHCHEYLERLDKYLLYHRFYKKDKEVFKDIQTPQLIRCMSEVLADRMQYDYNEGDLFQLCWPMRNVNWNFHDNKFSIPFRCLPAKTYEIDEMEDELQETCDSNEKYFDAEQRPNDCEFLTKERFTPDYITVIAHYIDDLVRKMVHLNRGNAEDVDMALKGEIFDNFSDMQIKKMVINGIDYSFNHEMNGTIFFVNSFDTNGP